MARSSDGRPIDPLIGMTLNDRYVVERRIGVGGMGTVYLGTHNRIGQKVAIKVLHERYANDVPLTQRFENEALAYGKVAHPNLVGLHDFGRAHEKLLFMVLEYCPGIALSKLLRERKRLPSQMAVDVVTQVAQGLGAAHATGLIHRDLKPENVVLMETRPGHFHVKLLDFGIAKTLGEEGPKLTQAGMVFGTPEYMAPEQARGEAVDERSDIYALGAMLYELVTGRPPFSGSNKMKVMNRQATETPQAFSERVPDLVVQDGVEAIARRCLEKAPSARYADTHALISALDAIGVETSSPLPIAAPRPEVLSVAPPETAMPSIAPVRSPEPSAGVVPQDSASWTAAALELADDPMAFGGTGCVPVQPTPRAGLVRPSLPLPGRNTLVAAAAIFCGVIGLAAWLFSAPASSEATEAEGPDPLTAIRLAVVDAEREITEREAAEVAAKAAAEAKAKAAEALAKAEASKAAQAKADQRRKAKLKAAKAAKAKADRVAQARQKDAERARQRAIKLARKDLRMGRIDAAGSSVTQLLKKHPKDKGLVALNSQIRGTRKALALGRLAYEQSECSKAIAALEPVLDVSPGASGVSHMVNSCRKAMPPAEL